MKKYFFVLALLLATGNAFAAYDEGSAIHNKEASKGSPADPTRVYMLVRYPEVSVDTPSISAGEVLVWDAISDDGVTVNRIARPTNGTAGMTTTGAASTDAVAGISVGTIPTADNASSAANSIGSRNWGYIQTYGLCSTAMVQATTVAGGAIAANDTAGDQLYAIPVTGANPRAGAIFAFAMDACSSDGNCEVFVENR